MRDAQTAPERAGRRLTVAIYLRVSTVDQEKRGFSIPEQRKACLEKAHTLAGALHPDSPEPPSIVAREFVDTAGGDLLERPELTRAREFVNKSRPDYFICLDPDRFSRATYQAILIANEIEAAGTKLEFVQHDYQATSEGRLFFTLRVAIAEYEKAKILERTSRGKRGKMAAGGIPHCIRAYGYDYVPEAERQIRRREGEPDSPALVPNPMEAVWVRQMFTWVAEEEIGSQAVAERLNRMAVPSKTGGAWRRHVVAGILQNPIYIGQLRLNRWDFTGLGAQSNLPPGKRTRKMTPRVRPESEWVTVAVPPLIDRLLFERSQAILGQMKRRSGTRIHPGRRGHLLSGILTCGLCGGPIHYAWNNKINGYLLRCANKYPSARGLKAPPAACRLVHLRAGPVEATVWESVRSWFDPDLLLEERKRTQDQPTVDLAEPERRLAVLAGQIGEGKSRQARVLYLVTRGVVHPEVAEAQLGEIQRHLAALEREQESVRQQAGVSVPAAAGSGEAAAAGGEVEEILEQIDQLDPVRRQTLVRMLVREVRVHGRDHVLVLPIE